MSWKYGGRAATFIAFFRAIESTAPATRRLLHDPFAAAFLRPWQQTVVSCCNAGFFRNMVKNLLQLRWAGGYTSVVTRTRRIDDIIKDAVSNNGINQIITLNARFDTRAHRLRTSIPVNYVEIDHPEMQQLKQSKLYDVIDMPVSFVDYIALDMEKESLSEVLVNHLQKEHYKTLFLWEGITSTLNPAIINDFFRYVARYPAGTQIIFSYIQSSALKNSTDTAMLKGYNDVARFLKNAGEDWNFSANSDTWKNIFQNRNMLIHYDGNANEFRHLYFKRQRSGMKGFEFCRIIHAELH
ncbi:class I SAM-dependent methyltransferase [Chitinophaga sp. Cy-1792]|uniref:class I SAM-dependent methyltransferase n=1 Tax=Chitinophaga sp. Cy-1792 TaxID=2608339 RepID=UPI00141E9B34|nr:class I SAM-dependent methyltransferase [Chitinophaga sp. Cy-1792]NIG53505.1 class I SAM-dependent methyltransferase [Chitinophaga sp. Cy-1792]